MLIIAMVVWAGPMAWAISLPVSADLQLWLTTDVGIIVDASGNVETWVDQSGQGNDFTQSTAGARPTLITGGGPGGVDVIHFDGLDDMLANLAQLVAGTSVTVFSVMAVREPGYPWALGTTINDRMFYEGHPCCGAGPDFVDIAHDFGNDARANLPGINDDQFKVLTITGSGTFHNLRVFVNGTPAIMTAWGVDAPLDFSPGNTLGFVHDTPNRFTEVDFVEFIVCDRELSETERESVEADLRNRYVPVSATTADHFVCYDVKEPKGLPKFEEQVVTLDDQFTGGERRVRKPKTICVPADKNGEGIWSPAVHLVCYEIKEPKGDSKFEKVDLDVLVTNQFGEQILTVRKPKTLCVPSTKEVIGSSP